MAIIDWNERANIFMKICGHHIRECICDSNIEQFDNPQALLAD